MCRRELLIFDISLEKNRAMLGKKERMELDLLGFLQRQLQDKMLELEEVSEFT